MLFFPFGGFLLFAKCNLFVPADWLVDQLSAKYTKRNLFANKLTSIPYFKMSILCLLFNTLTPEDLIVIEKTNSSWLTYEYRKYGGATNSVSE